MRKLKAIKCFFVGHKNTELRAAFPERECSCCGSRQFKYSNTGKWLTINV